MFRPCHWAIIRSRMVTGGNYTVCCIQRDLVGVVIISNMEYLRVKVIAKSNSKSDNVTNTKGTQSHKGPKIDMKKPK